MKNEEDPMYIICDDHIMAHFLDGLIYFKRGKDESRPPQAFELPVTNNLVLKKTVDQIKFWKMVFICLKYLTNNIILMSYMSNFLFFIVL